MRDVGSRVAQLANCPIAEVRAEWQRVVGKVAPSVPPMLLRQMTAHAIQVKRWRGLPASVERELDRIASGAGGGGGGKPPPGTPIVIRPGTRLVRSWNGRTISVLATKDGFVWEDRGYASLSQIAREVTGARWSGVATALIDGSTKVRREVLRRLIERVVLRQHHLDIHLSAPALMDAVGLPSTDAPLDPIMLTCRTVRLRKGHEIRLVIPGRDPGPDQVATRDEKLVALLSEAKAARTLVLSNRDQPLAAIASSAGRCRSRFGRLVALSCLAPDIVTAIMAGRQPASLTAATLATIDLPLDWRDQRAALGIA